MKEIETLAIIEDGNKILLAMKKRGFGMGWWNGFGGKLKENEGIETAMIRELEEESGLIAKSYKKKAVIEFIFKGKDREVEMHVFEVSEYEGEPKETDEMLPKWFDKAEIPYDKMWPVDKLWLPIYFEGKDFEGQVIFDGETKALLKSDFHIEEDR